MTKDQRKLLNKLEKMQHDMILQVGLNQNFTVHQIQDFKNSLDHLRQYNLDGPDLERYTALFRWINNEKKVSSR
jgi:TusA-related sulfurtransferase